MTQWEMMYGSPDDEWYYPTTKKDDSQKTEPVPEVEDRIGLREESIDWTRFKKFRDTL